MRGNWIKQKSVTTGISDIVLTAFGPDFPTFLDVFAADTSVDYCIRTGNQWEEGLGIIRADGTLERTRVDVTWNGVDYDDTTPSPITIAADSTVFTAFSADSIVDRLNNLSDLANISTARINLGLEIGVDVQAFSSVLTDLVGLSPADSNFIVGDGANFIVESGATARISIGLGVGDSVTFADLTIADDGDLTLGGTGQILLPQVNDAANPTLAFSGNTGFFESADDVLNISIAGVARWQMVGNLFKGLNNNFGPALVDTNPSNTVPVFSFGTDLNTGMGQINSDSISLIVGGLEGIRITEVSGDVTVNVFGDLIISDDSDIVLGGTGQLLLPQVNDPTNPTLTFGSNDGFFSSGAGFLRVAIVGAQKFLFSSSAFQSLSSQPAASIVVEAATATNPVFTFASDLNTGVGSAAADQLSLIAGGVEGIRVTEVASDITVNVFGDLNIPINKKLSFGDGDTYFIETADDTLRLYLIGTQKIVIVSGFTQFGPSGGPLLLHETASATNPIFTSSIDENTGIGFAGADQLSLIAGGVRGLGVSEASSIITIDFFGNTVYPKASGNGIKVDNAAPTFGWADILGDQFSKNTGATKPALATYNGAITAWQFAVGDEVYISYHIPHDYVKGSDIFLHIHWSHTGTLVTGGTVTFKATSIYAKGHNQAAFGAPVSGTFTGNASTTQYQHILSEIQYSDSVPTGLEIDTDLLEPDGVIELTLELDVNSITVSGGGVPEPFIHFVDVHYQSTGLIGTKDKVPDFYV